MPELVILAVVLEHPYWQARLEMTHPTVRKDSELQDSPREPGRQVGQQVLLRRGRQELDADIAFSIRDAVVLGMEGIRRKRRDLRDLKKEIEN